MFYGSFKTTKSVEEVLDAINENVVKNLHGNWGVDCFVGKVHRKGFRIYHHKAYMKNSFNKTAYGRVWAKNGETRVFYLLISPFLSWRVYVTILVASLMLSISEKVLVDYIVNVITLLQIAIFPLMIGLFSQIIPAPFKKARIDEMISQAIEINTAENNA